MKRLDLLKKELTIINNLDCLSFNVKEKAVEYYKHEIECIEMFGSVNPDVNTRNFYNIDLKSV